MALHTLCSQLQLLRLYTAVHSCEGMADSTQFATCYFLPQGFSEVGYQSRTPLHGSSRGSWRQSRADALADWRRCHRAEYRAQASSSMQLCSTRILQHLCLKALQLSTSTGYVIVPRSAVAEARSVPQSVCLCTVQAFLLPATRTIRSHRGVPRVQLSPVIKCATSSQVAGRPHGTTATWRQCRAQGLGDL